MVRVGLLAKAALSAPQMRSTGLSCGLERAPCNTTIRGWVASHRRTILAWWMITLSQITAIFGAVG